MSHKKIYTGIGSRETPEQVLNQMTRIGATLATHDWTLRSGHAPGADQAFEWGALHVKNSKMEIYLPWQGFEGARSDGKNYFATSNPSLGCNPEAERIAAQFHPNWAACSQGAKKLHTRNVYQVVGADLATPSDMVICWTKDGKRGGGTGQALRMASYLGIPIFDLAVCTLEDILEFVNHGVVPLR